MLAWKNSLSLYIQKELEGSFIFKRYVLFACYHAYQFVKKKKQKLVEWYMGRRRALDRGKYSINKPGGENDHFPPTSSLYSSSI